MIVSKIKKGDVDAALVRKLFNYNTTTGHLTYKINTRYVIFGKRVGTVQTDYRRISIGGRLYLEHRIIWLHVYGKWPDHIIDHVNGNGLDNRLTNLRAATTTQNMINARKKRRGPGVKNIHQHKGKWVVKLTLGPFDTQEEAALFAYNTMKQFHGEFVNPEHYGLQKIYANGDQHETEWEGNKS